MNKTPPVFRRISLSFHSVSIVSWAVVSVDSCGQCRRGRHLCKFPCGYQSKVSSSSSHHPHCGCGYLFRCRTVFMCVIVRFFFYLTSKVETRSSTFSSTEWHVCLICVNNFVDEKQDKLKCGLIWNTCVLWFPMDTCGYSSAGHNSQVNGDFYYSQLKCGNHKF